MDELLELRISILPIAKVGATLNHISCAKTCVCVYTVSQLLSDLEPQTTVAI